MGITILVKTNSNQSEYQSFDEPSDQQNPNLNTPTESAYYEEQIL